ncbi:hypothetical protein, partial [Vibrio vulnificus]|uniref:hypothetical protein n=2 Tax=Vibrio TaxID=662 RepID=UPI003568285D
GRYAYEGKMEDDFDIYPTNEAFYIECLYGHTNSALDSVYKVGEWIRLVVENDEKAHELAPEELFQELQNIVQQAASISKYFWSIRKGTKGVHKKRSRKLRQSLRISEDSALKSRELRDHLEHFDEKLDCYLTQNHVGQFIPLDIAAEPPKSDVPLHIFRGFYINPRIFVLLGNRYELTPIVAELEFVHTQLSNCIKNGYRLPTEYA